MFIFFNVFISDHLDNTDFEVNVDYHKRDDSLDKDNQTLVVYNTLQEQHSCTTDNPFSSSPSSTISPYLTSYRTTKCTESESPYYHVLVDEKASVSVKTL